MFLEVRIFFKAMVWGGLSLAVATFSQEALAVKASVVGNGGYETIRFSKDLSMNGFGLGAAVEVNAIDLTAGTDFLLGAALKYYSVSTKVNSVDFSMSQLIFGPYLGVSIKANPKFTISSTLGYDFGLSGKFASKANGVEVSKDTKSYSSVTHEWRGVFNVAPQAGVGIGLGWQAGTVEIPVLANTNTTSESDFRGFALRVLGAFTF